LDFHGLSSGENGIWFCLFRTRFSGRYFIDAGDVPEFIYFKKMFK